MDRSKDVSHDPAPLRVYRQFFAWYTGGAVDVDELRQGFLANLTDRFVETCFWDWSGPLLQFPAGSPLPGRIDLLGGRGNPLHRPQRFAVGGIRLSFWGSDLEPLMARCCQLEINSKLYHDALVAGSRDDDEGTMAASLGVPVLRAEEQLKLALRSESLSAEPVILAAPLAIVAHVPGIILRPIQ